MLTPKIIFGLLLTSLTLEISGQPISNYKAHSNQEFCFLQNEGQWNAAIVCKGISLHSNVYILKDGLSFSHSTKTTDDLNNASFLVWNMKFMNTQNDYAIKIMNTNESVYSFLSGQQKENWIIHPNLCSSILYEELYERIDLKFYGNGSQLEYDYVVHPGGAIQDIASRYEGVKNLGINDEGDLEINTGWIQQIQKAPVSWQEVDGVRTWVKIEYSLLNDTTFGFIEIGRAHV